MPAAAVALSGRARAVSSWRTWWSARVRSRRPHGCGVAPMPASKSWRGRSRGWVDLCGAVLGHADRDRRNAGGLRRVFPSEDIRQRQPAAAVRASCPRVPLAPSARAEKEGKDAQDDRAGGHARARTADAGAIGLGRRQLRGHPLRRPGSPSPRHPGQGRSHVQAPRGRRGAAIQSQRGQHRQPVRRPHPLRCRRGQRPGWRHPVHGGSRGGAVNGTLAEGTITAPDPGNACGWADLAAVLAAMGSGATYVNVHTDDGVEPPNTGPGDFPGGEIRGQIR
jgi:hypothetical protein